MDAPTLTHLLQLAGLTPDEAPSWTGYTPQHWNKLRRGDAQPFRLLRLALEMRAGELAHISDRWEGWRLDPRTGDLTTPDGDYWTPETLRQLHWYHEKLAEERATLRGRLRALEAENAALRAAQDTPPAYPHNVIPLRPRTYKLGPRGL